MKISSLLLFLAILVCAALPAVAQNPAPRTATLKIMSINIRHNSDWPESRFPLLADEIVRLQPDIIGLQEVLIGVDQSRELLRLITERAPDLKYEYYEHIKTGAYMISGEGVAIFSRFPIKAEKMQDLDQGRVALAARIAVNDDLSVDFYNTHLHHQGGDAVRLPQAQKITGFMDKLSAGRLVFLTGDMNASADSATIAHYLGAGLVDAYTEAHGTDLGEQDMTSPIILSRTPVPQKPGNRIDYIFYKQPGAGPRVTAIRDVEVCFRNLAADGLYPSDHLGVIATFDIAYASGPGASAAQDAALYLFAHQDDEALIIAKMAGDLRRGRSVHAIWITDGSGTADPATREAEARGVMARAGVPSENLYFLGYKDRDSWKSLDAVLADVLAVARKIQPVELTANAYEGGNIDHDVASLIGALVAQRVPVIRAHHEFPLYNSYKGQYRVNKFLPFEGAETLYTRLDSELGRLKMDVIEMYPTQAAIVDTLKLLIDKKSLKANGEPYRAAPAYDYRKRPVDEPLGYEANMRNPVSFDDWLSTVIPFLDKLDAVSAEN